MTLPLDDPDFVSLGEAADILRISRKTLRKRIDDGTIPAVRIGNLIRIRRYDLVNAGNPLVRSS